jgi:hypothetical protein
VLRSLESLGPGAQTDANVARVWPLPAGLDPRAVSRMWWTIVAANHSLRTVYDIGPDRLMQKVLDPSMAPLATASLPEGTTEAAARVASELAADPFDISADLPWRLVVGMHGGTARFLTGVFHNIATDGTGLLVMGEQLVTTAGDGALTVTDQPLDLALEQRAGTRRHQRALAHWASVWPDLLPQDRLGADPSDRAQAALYTVGGYRAAQQVARVTGVSIQCVILSACLLALMSVKRRGLTVGLVASNRMNRRWRRLVTSMNQLAPLTARPEPDTATTDFLQQIFGSAMEAYSHGAYDVDELTRHLAGQGHHDPDPMRFDCFFNYLGETGVDLPADDAAAAGLAWLPPTRRNSGPALNLLVSTGAGLLVSCRSSERYLAPHRLAVYLGAVEATLLDMADRTPRTIADIDMRPRRPLPPIPPALRNAR